MSTANDQEPSAASGGSETMGPGYRRQLRGEIEALKDYLKALEGHASGDCVIQYYAMESVLQTANRIGYLVGMVNGTCMARWDKSPNNADERTAGPDHEHA